MLTLTKTLVCSTPDHNGTVLKGEVHSNNFILTQLTRTKNGSVYLNVLKDIITKSGGDQVQESADDFSSSLIGLNNPTEKLSMDIGTDSVSPNNQIDIKKHIGYVITSASIATILKDDNVTSQVTTRLSNRTQRSERCSPIEQRELCPSLYNRRLEITWKRSLQEVLCINNRVTAITGSLIECVQKYGNRRVQLKECNGTMTCYDYVTIGVGCDAVLPCIV